MIFYWRKWPYLYKNEELPKSCCHQVILGKFVLSSLSQIRRSYILGHLQMRFGWLVEEKGIGRWCTPVAIVVRARGRFRNRNIQPRRRRYTLASEWCILAPTLRVGFLETRTRAFPREARCNRKIVPSQSSHRECSLQPHHWKYIRVPSINKSENYVIRSRC